MKKRNLIITATILYTVLILYFMFLGFNRLQGGDYEGYVFEFGPIVGPLGFPRLSFGWVYDLGNIAAFIPFGILLPLLYRYTYKKLISLFIVCILVLETLQALTHLGSFDINDVISNTLGATIGYVVYKIGFTSKITPKKLIASCMSAIILIFCVMLVSEVIEKRTSSLQPLQAIEEATGVKPQTKQMPSFTIDGQQIEPQSNLYMSEKGTSQMITYTIEGKEELVLYLNLGIPDDEEFQGKVTIVADGEEKFKRDEQYLKEFSAMERALEVPLFFEYDTLTITITGNMKVWDVSFTELKHWWE
ncbi:VanZ family protein [Lysinibacillus louembei]|uniref:VanZ family protein n=1 Tax=Lysinibacillus louembei TaxID=1470088 RepID=A0ABZ0RR17_9BACI|nr:VanZ family protein [Lysinibacillus louembei]WPK10663.1 VanZ family protein [Lysinibacillus louembei]